jgi:hypothetical protein
VPSSLFHISLSQLEKPFFQIFICIVLALFGWTAYSYFQYPYGLDYGEAPLMDQARRLEENQPLYKANIDEPPYLITNYPPLYPISVAALNGLLNIPLFQAGRLISIVFSSISGVVIGILGYQLTNNKLLGALAGAIFWGNPYVLIWSSIARVDSMALAFSLLGLWAVYQSRKSRYWLIAACIFFLASVYTRQTYLLAGPLAGFVWLLFTNKRRALIFLFTLAISTILLFGIINALTNGGFFTNIVVANNNQYEFARTIRMSQQLLIFWPFILLVAVVTFLMLGRVYKKMNVSDIRNTDSTEFIILGLGGYSLGAGISALTVGKVGSDINYFLELIAVCSIWCVVAINHFSTQKKQIRNVFFILMSFQLVWATIAGVVLSRRVIAPRQMDLPLYNALFNQVKTATHEGYVLSDDYLDLVVLAGQSIYYQPFEYGQLYQAGLWDPSQFAGDIHRGLFPLIVIGGDTINKPCCWPQPIQDEIEKNYLETRSKLGLILNIKK